MILLPVIDRELRVAARRKQTYRNRFFAALGIIAVLLWVIWDSHGVPQNALGNEIFEYISTTALCVSLLAGFFHTADCISEERREGTLGLLYLTDLRGLHVILGKLVANSIPAFFALATLIPVLGIPFLLGGITAGELERMAVILLNGLWLSLAAGLFASSLAKDDRAALLLTFAFILVPTAIAPMFHHASLSAFWAADASRDRVFLGRQQQFWLAMAEQFTLPCVYVLLASMRARIIWRDKPPTAAGAQRRARWRVWTSGTAAQRQEWRAAMLEENPALWLACRRRERSALLWAVLGIGMLWLAWIWFDQHRIEMAVGILASMVFHWILKITFAFAACRAISEEARNGSLELLFTTDLSPNRLINGHLAGLARSFGPAVAIVVMFDLLWATFGRADGIFSTDMRPFLWGRTGILLLDLVTIGYFGVWMGYKSQRSGRAAIWTLLYVIIFPNLAWIFLLTGRNSGFGLVFFTWIVMDTVLISIGTSKLKTLRERAAERFAPSSAPG